MTSPNLIIDDIVGGFDSFIRFEYDSELHNFEFTRRILRQYDDWAYSTLLGVRYTDFQERLHLFGEDACYGLPVVQPCKSGAQLVKQGGFTFAGGRRRKTRLHPPDQLADDDRHDQKNDKDHYIRWAVNC